jgi:hypothetical protein
LARNVRSAIVPTLNIPEDSSVIPSTEPVAPSAGNRLSLQPIVSECGAGECATVYLTDRNTAVVQGYAMAAEDAGIAVPYGELLVEIPLTLLALAVQNLGQQ